MSSSRFPGWPETGAPAFIHEGRIESVLKQALPPVDFVSARALASLADLLEMASPLLANGDRAAFHKGEDFDVEFVEASKSWSIDMIRHKSLIDPQSLIVEIVGATRKPRPGRS